LKNILESTFAGGLDNNAVTTMYQCIVVTFPLLH